MLYYNEVCYAQLSFTLSWVCDKWRWQ